LLLTRSHDSAQLLLGNANALMYEPYRNTFDRHTRQEQLYGEPISEAMRIGNAREPEQSL